MDWNIMPGIVIAALAAIGLPLALRRRRKAGPKKKEEFCHHLQKMGVKAYMMQTGDNREKIGQKHSWGEKSMGIIELKDRNIDFINIIGIASQYGVNYFLNYLVKTPNILGSHALRKTRLVRKRSSLLWGKTTDIEWRGDKSLAQSLNFDLTLKDKLLQADLNVFKGGISISSESKHEYARIRTAYFLPSSEAFEAIDIIARHAKSW